MSRYERSGWQNCSMLSSFLKDDERKIYCHQAQGRCRRCRVVKGQGFISPVDANR